MNQNDCIKQHVKPKTKMIQPCSTFKTITCYENKNIKVRCYEVLCKPIIKKKKFILTFTRLKITYKTNYFFINFKIQILVNKSNE